MLSSGTVVGIVLGSLAAAAIFVVLLVTYINRRDPLHTTQEKPSNAKPDTLVTIPSANTTTTTVTPRSAPAPKPKATNAAPKAKPTSSYAPRNNYKSKSSGGYLSSSTYNYGSDSYGGGCGFGGYDGGDSGGGYGGGNSGGC
ncbi:hypothetical protein BGZ96_003846 [Linnemannia gamsii]|uniref:Uncharacterized protein n=1 Tax=Linnemannia gamsii TaxID=64522 RepID=A0ABQ7JIQ5_9FUNG|nr:hypothetical protein BGZ96_003846 [Linnemannia gamsii]